jgi:hypothetical protein
MNITHYSFGKIEIDGKTYSSDVIVYPDRVNSSWWRIEGHLLQVPDLKDVVSKKPAVLIVGTGYYGAMKVPEKTLDYLKSKNIEVYTEKTSEAIKMYNKISAQKQTIAALHLTC